MATNPECQVETRESFSITQPSDSSPSFKTKEQDSALQTLGLAVNDTNIACSSWIQQLLPFFRCHNLLAATAAAKSSSLSLSYIIAWFSSDAERTAVRSRYITSVANINNSILLPSSSIICPLPILASFASFQNCCAMEGELIPGLPVEIARDCLIRLPFDAFRAAHAVCRLWKRDIESPYFHRLRISAGLARPIVALVQSQVSPVPASRAKHSVPSPLLYRLVLFDPVVSAWSSPPAVPSLSHGLPLFCHLAAVGRELVVVGGWDPRTWAASDEVHVYDVVSGAWRRGARMPGPRRSFFACAAAADRRAVFVAGGHDESKNALQSALIYDVAADAWVELPDMARPRDECQGVFMGGAFRVVGGYPTEQQGQFTRSVQAFDVAAWQWGEVEDGALGEAAGPRTCVVERAGRVYACREEREVAVLEEGGGGWRKLTELPRDVRAALQMVAWEGGLMVLGSAAHVGAQVAYVLEMDSGATWRKVESPREYSGNVQAGCCFQV